MQIQATDKSILDWTGDILALGFYEGATDLTGDLAQLDEKLAGTLHELITDEEFEGKTGTSAVTRISGKNNFRKLILIG